MPLFIVFIMGAMLCGAGAMLAPALPTSQPRVGLAAAFTLALIMGGSLFMLSLTANDPLVIDYVLFALLSGTVLGGTIAQAQTRAEAKGEELSDADQGWTGPQDLLFFVLVGILLTGVLLITQPFQTGASSAGLEMLTSYVSRQLRQTHPIVQRALGAVIAFLAIWVVYDFGSEWRGKPLGRCLALAAIPVVVALYANGHFVVLLGVLFGLAMLIFLQQAVQTRQRLDLVAAGLMFGACLYASVEALIVMALVALAWTWYLQRPKPTGLPRTRLLWLIPLIALLATGPWWLTHLELVASNAYEMLRSPDDALLLVAAFGSISAGGWMLWALWRQIPADLRAMLRQRYYVLAVITAVVLVAGIVLSRAG